MFLNFLLYSDTIKAYSSKLLFGLCPGLIGCIYEDVSKKNVPGGGSLFLLHPGDCIASVSFLIK